MKRVLIMFFIIILIFALFNFKIIDAKESNSNLKFPQVHNPCLDTSLEGNDHLYFVKIGGRFGLIDVNGKLVIEPKFTQYGFYYNKYHDKGFYTMLIQKEDYDVGDQNLKDPDDDTYLITKSKIIKFNITSASIILTNNEKYAYVHYYVSKNGEDVAKSFLFDIEKEKVIDESKENYEVIDVFDEGYIAKENNLYYMKTFDKQNLTCGFARYSWFDGNAFVFRDFNNALYLIDKNGNTVFEYKNPCKSGFIYKDIAVILDEDDNLIFMNKNGDIIKTYKGFKTVTREGNFYIAKSSETEYVIFDYEGNKKTTLNYNDEFAYNMFSLSSTYSPKEPFKYFNETKGIYQVFDISGDIKASYKIPDGYKAIDSINDCIVLSWESGNGLYRIMDENIEWILEPKYKYIRIHDENMIYVESEDFNGYVNYKGQFIYVGISS